MTETYKSHFKVPDIGPIDFIYVLQKEKFTGF